MHGASKNYRYVWDVSVPRPMWHMLVGGKMGGSLRIVRGCRFLRVERNSYQLVWPWCGDTCGCLVPPAGAASFLKGLECTPSLLPSHTEETIGLVRIATASLQLSFLKVFVGMRRLRVLGAWWDFIGGRISCVSYLFRRSTSIDICFFFLSLIFILG
jgi:hypothetical protein